MLVFKPFAWPLWLRLPKRWDAVTLQQYQVAQQLLPGATIIERLRWQIAVYSGVPARVLKGCTDRQLLRVSRKMAFLKTPVPQDLASEIKLAGIQYTRTDRLADIPLAQWITLEQRILKPPDMMPSIASGALTHLPELMACLLVPAGQAFDARQIDRHAKALRFAPVGQAMGLRNWLLQELQQIEQQYTEIFEPQNDNNSKAALSDQALYFRRWGWSAILAELNGGELLPDVRELLLQSPTEIIFQELARRQHKAQIDEQHLKALKRHASH